jgi:hypothetical protein
MIISGISVILKKVMLKLSRPVIITSAALFFVGIGFLTRGAGSNNENNNLLSTAAFLFGIFVAFSVANSQSRLNKINENIKAEEATLLFIYKISKIFGKEIQEQTKQLIDLYLIDQIDFYLKDYKYSSKSFNRLFDYLIALNPQKSATETAYSSMVSSLAEAAKNRKQVEAAVTEQLAPLEWFSILTLLALILFFIFYMNDGSLVSVVTSTLLAVASVVVVLVLKDLDSLQWKEQSWIWEPLENLFKELNLVPYYPEDLIKDQRIKLEKGDKVRVATYQNSYPDMSDKLIRVIEV